MELLRDDALRLVVGEVENRLAPTVVLGTVFSQLQPIVRLPRQTGRILERLPTAR